MLNLNQVTSISDEELKDVMNYHPIRKLRDARMDCNSAITHDGKF